MRKPPVQLVIDEESFRRARERPEAKEALKRLAELIVESFIETIPAEELPMLHEYFKAREGDKLFVELWPQIVDAYFKALCAPARKRSPSHYS
jgi:hypothetical protein